MTSNDTQRSGGALIFAAIAAVVIAVMSAAFAISFTALIYKGALAPYLGYGIFLSLISVITLGGIGALSFSFRGTICGPQDVTSILLGSAGASMALGLGGTSDSLFQTVALFVAIASILSGLAAYMCGRWRLGYLARFVPYPVIGGFLAATGYLLTTSALGMATGHEVTIWSLIFVLIEANPLTWMPWFLGAVLILTLTRRGMGDAVLPGVMIAGVAGFFVILAFSGVSVEAAQGQGYLLGPFDAFSISGMASVVQVVDIDWRAILSNIPTLIAVAGLTILGTLLNATGLEMVTDQGADFERDLRASGQANMVTGLFGGMPGYQLIGETLLARNMGLSGRLAGASAVMGAVIILAFGADVLGFVPIGVLAMLIAYLGLDLLLTWLWDERARLSGSDFLIIVLIVLAAAFIGFLQALAVGLLAAVAIFVYSYARLDVVRLRSSGTTRRSRVERPGRDRKVLRRMGDGLSVLELTGFLFFGSANKVTGQVQSEFTNDPAPRHIIIDFAHVKGIDASAIFELRKIAKLCHSHHAHCVFSGLGAAALEMYQRATPQEDQATLTPTLDAALEEFETSILKDIDSIDGTETGALFTLVSRVMDEVPDSGAVVTRSLQAGDVLMEEGGSSPHIFLLKSGGLRADVVGSDGAPLLMARFLPGAPVGEIAYYAGVPRTATVTAQQASEVYQLDPAILQEAAPGRYSELHKLMATHIAQRLIRTTQLVKDAGI